MMVQGINSIYDGISWNSKAKKLKIEKKPELTKESSVIKATPFVPNL